MTTNAPLEARVVVRDAGGPLAVSKVLGITSQAVTQWKKIPPQHCLDIEKISNYNRHDMRPDIFGETRE